MTENLKRGREGEREREGGREGGSACATVCVCAARASHGVPGMHAGSASRPGPVSGEDGGLPGPPGPAGDRPRRFRSLRPAPRAAPDGPYETRMITEAACAAASPSQGRVPRDPYWGIGRRIEGLRDGRPAE